MRSPLAGIRVLEVAMYGFVTSAGAVLADWGAEVLKVEHAVSGDPQHGLRRTGSFVVEGDLNPNVEHPNRGKRSIGLDISVESGREVLDELIGQADVFLTSLLPSSLQRFRIDVDDVRAVNPDVIYARGSALGPRGVEADRGGYDMTAFWARAATAASITPPNVDGIITSPAPAYGDTISGTNLAGGIAAALFARERTGEPSVVDVSLLGSGLWAMGMAIDSSLLQHKPWAAPRTGKLGSRNPLSSLYRTADGRYLSFVMLQAARYWADVCRHVGRPELADDPRFADAESIDAHAEEAAELLREAIGAQPVVLGDAPRHAERAVGPGAGHAAGGPRPPGGGQRVHRHGVAEDGSEYPLVRSPVQFDEHAPELRRAPQFAEHTDEVLAGLGLDWDRILALKVDGAVT